MRHLKGVAMIPFPKYIQNYKLETIHAIIKESKAVLKRSSQAMLIRNTRVKLADCERELERRSRYEFKI